MGAAIVAGPQGAAGQINATAITGNGEPRLRLHSGTRAGAASPLTALVDKKRSTFAL
jgi:hypothetical protein